MSSQHQKQSQKQIQPIQKQIVSTFYMYWIMISGPIIIYECMFLLLRPQTMKDGDLFAYFQSFDSYISIDPLFGEIDNWFIPVLIIFNISQVSLNFLGLILYKIIGSQKCKIIGAGLLMFIGMGSFYKTLIFLVYDFDYFQWQQGNSFNVIFVYILPNLCWVVFPFVGMLSIFKQLFVHKQYKQHFNTQIDAEKKVK